MAETAAASVAVETGSRLYASDVGEYGQVQRTTFLGLKDAPVVQLDNGSLRAYCGPEKQKVIETETKRDLLHGDLAEGALPTDVRTVGIEQLTSHGVPPEIQARMFQNWYRLPKQQRLDYTESWAEVDHENPEELAAFLDAMVDYLTDLDQEDQA